MRTTLTGRRRWVRGRLPAALAAVCLSAALGAAAAATPAAAAPPIRDPDCFFEDYGIHANHGLVLSPTEPKQIVFNNNPSAIPVTFTSSQSATRSTTFQASTQVSGGFKIGVINTTVSQSFGISTMNSATTQIGVSVGPMQLPPGTYQMGEYGVWRLMTTGTYYKQIVCGQMQEVFGTAFSVTGTGWQVWQE